MASEFQRHCSHLDQLEQSNPHLSSNVIGVVLPRDRGVSDRIAVAASSPRRTYVSPKHKHAALSPKPRVVKTKKTSKSTDAKQETRRAQLRAGQARFREKQRKELEQIEHRVQHLQHEIRDLKVKRQRLKLRGTAKPYPWQVVSEVFHLVDSCFQSPSCVIDPGDMASDPNTRRSLQFLNTVILTELALGELHGVAAVQEQLKRYALSFGSPQLDLEQIKKVAPEVMKAFATLSVTVTDNTLQQIFPGLDRPKGIDDKVLHRSLREKRLRCCSSMTFFFQEESGCLGRLKIEIDLLQALDRVLGNVEEAANVLEQALISRDCVVFHVK